MVFTLCIAVILSSPNVMVHLVERDSDIGQVISSDGFLPEIVENQTDLGK